MEKLKRASAREQIKESILKGISNGTFKPGTRLREKELAERFGTSQAPVREALRELEGLQYVVTYPYKGTVVREVTIEDLAIAYRLRGMFEQTAVELLSKRDTRDWQELKEIAIQIEEAAKNKDKESYAKLNTKFHKYLINTAGNSMLDHMWDLVSFPLQVESALKIIDMPLVDLSHQHLPIINALEKNDCELAGKLLVEHANVVRDHLLDKIENQS